MKLNQKADFSNTSKSAILKTSLSTILFSMLFSLLVVGCSKPTEPEKDAAADSVTNTEYEASPSYLLSTLKLQNTSESDFKNVPVTVTKEQLLNQIQQAEVKDSAKQNKILSAISNATLSLFVDGEAIISQQDDLDGDGNWDELVFLIDIQANSEVSVRVENLPINKMMPRNNNTNIRFAQFSNTEKTNANELMSLSRKAEGLADDYARQFQMEGPAWENQHIGFRTYFDERNGFDIFGKTNANLVLDKVGLGQNYHEMQTWGMDILKVGRSLGAGGLVFVTPSKTDMSAKYVRLSNAVSSRASILKEGPIRSIFDLDYEGLSHNGKTFDLKHRISIWSNQDHYVGQVTISNSETSSLPFSLAVGIVNFHNAKLDRIKSDNYSLLSTFGPQAELNTSLGMAVLSASNKHIAFDSIGEAKTGIEKSELSVFMPTTNTQLAYRFYAIWQPRFEDIDSIEVFTAKMKNEAEKLSSIKLQF
jgi:hypothetical protein